MIKKFSKVLVKLMQPDALLDPIEVFYLPTVGEVYPINSKAGCSSVKLLLIQLFAPDFQAVFPDIHHVDPAGVTTGQVVRLFFNTRIAYQNFCAGKKVVLVIREPTQRWRSFANGVLSGTNILYQYPCRLDGITLHLKRLTPLQLLRVTAQIPDRLADRHFRTQAFLLPGRVAQQQLKTEVLTLAGFLRRNSTVRGPEAPRLNVADYTNRMADFDKATRHPAFMRRYAADAQLYEAAWINEE